LLLRLTDSARRSSALRGFHRPLQALAATAALSALVAAQLVGPARVRADNASPLGDLVDAAAQRLQIAEPVAAVKWSTHGVIEDPARVQQELDKLGADATTRHVDPGYVRLVFGDQINATEGVEYARFADWKLDPSSAPATAPDLSASRAAIDGLNQTMLTQIVANWDVLHSPACAAQLDVAKIDAVRARQFDGLYQRALALATQSYCA
jgi:chorismate mutase